VNSFLQHSANIPSQDTLPESADVSGEASTPQGGNEVGNAEAGVAESGGLESAKSTGTAHASQNQESNRPSEFFGLSGVALCFWLVAVSWGTTVSAGGLSAAVLLALLFLFCGALFWKRGELSSFHFRRVECRRRKRRDREHKRRTRHTDGTFVDTAEAPQRVCIAVQATPHMKEE